MFITAYLFRCTFETNDGSASLCGMQQDMTYDTRDFDWTLWKGATPSKETGIILPLLWLVQYVTKTKK